MHRAFLVMVLGSGCAGSLVSPVLAQVIRVPQDQPGVAEAVSAAPDGAEVHVAAGTWDVRGIAVAGRTITIVGAGTDQTILSGGGVARGFHVTAGSRLAVRELTVRDCMATQGGGGAFLVESASLRLDRCSLVGNQGGDHGGAIMMHGTGEVLIERSAFIGNAALHNPYGDGGAIFAGGGGNRLVIESTLFRENHAPYHAGAVAAFTPSRFNNCVFERNSSSYGGAIRTYHVGNMLTFTHCTFLDNTAAYGSAIFSYYGDIRLVNCALRGPGSLLDAVYGGRFHGAGCVMSSGSLEGYGNITADPQIGPDYVPLATSPCVDAGIPQIIATPWSWGGADTPCAVVEQDLRGNPRWRDHPGFPNTGCHIPRAAIDVGAVELGGIVVRPALPADINDDEAVDGDDLGRLLADWGFPDCGSDLNADGVVDGTDLGFLLSRWGGCHGQF